MPTKTTHSDVHLSVSLTMGQTSFLSLRPIAAAERIAPPEAKPKAGMKTNELTAITTLNDARVEVPNPDITKLTNRLNAPNSRNQLKPLGRPKRNTRRNSRRLTPNGLPVFLGAPPNRRQKQNARNPKPSQLPIALASAVPATPIAGAPRWP